MSRSVARLPEGSRISDYLSLGLIAKSFPLPRVHAALALTGRASRRQRELPAHVMVYYAIALALYMQSSYREVLRCLLEGVGWLSGTGTGSGSGSGTGTELAANVTGNSGISQARTRLGAQPLARLHDELVVPIAGESTRGAWWRTWRVVSLDGSTLDVADEAANVVRFGRPGASRGQSAYPKLRFVSLVESGTHVLFGTRWGSYATGENTLAIEVLGALRTGMLCLADRGFFGFPMWGRALSTGATQLWRVKKNLRLPCEQRLPDGSYLSRIYPTELDRRHQQKGVVVRVIEYRLDGVAGSEPIYRLITNLLDHESAPALELAALYQERWEIETALDELKTHLRGAQIVLRSKTPELGIQEFYGLLMAHFAVRSLMHEAALKADIDVDRLSFLHAVRVIRRKLPLFEATPP